MKFEIHSHEGAEKVRFGMTVNEAREAIGGEFQSVKKHEGDHPADVFGEFECFVYYDDGGKVEAMEFFKPGRVMLGGVDLLGLSYADLVKLITEQDPNVVIETDGFTSEKLGIGSYAPAGVEEPGNPGEAIIVFRRGYYDD